jgi:hypothetical protein
MRRSYKRYLVSSPPPVLVIHLKRFQQISKSPVAIFGNLKKLDDYVPFPEFLNLEGYMAPKAEDFGLGGGDVKMGNVGKEEGEASVMYRLVAVVVHIGNMVYPPSLPSLSLFAHIVLARRPLCSLRCSLFLFRLFFFSTRNGSDKGGKRLVLYK